VYAGIDNDDSDKFKIGNSFSTPFVAFEKTTNNATFAGTLSAGAGTFTGLDVDGNVEQHTATPTINYRLTGTGNVNVSQVVTTLSSNAASWDIRTMPSYGGGPFVSLYAAYSEVKLRTGNTDALTIDSSQNATFAGKAYINGSSGGNNAELAVTQSANIASIGNATLLLDNTNTTAGSAPAILFQSTEDSSGSNRRAVIEGAYDGGTNGGKLVFSTRNTDGSSWNDGVLVLDDDANATFAGDVTAGNTSGESQILLNSADSSVAVLRFGSPSDAIGAQVGWNYDASSMFIQTDKVGASISIRTGSGVDNLTLSGAAGSQQATFAGDVNLASTNALYFDGGGGNTYIRENATDSVQIVTGGFTAAFFKYSGGDTILDISDTQGGQIKFPATQNASSDANTLDDYQEGTATVTMSAGTSGTITLSAGADTIGYIKIGKLVHFQGRLQISSVSSPVGTLKIEGLPFTSADLTDFGERSPVTVWTASLGTAASGGVSGFVTTSDTTVEIQDNLNTTGGPSDFANHMAANTVIYVQGSYIAAS